MPIKKSGSDNSLYSMGTDRSMDSSSASQDMEGFKLEAVADLMQEQLRAENLVRDNKYGMKSYSNSFRGCDAVTALKDILQMERLQPTSSDDSNAPVTREDALDVGRRIAKDYRFFVHVGLKKNDKLVLEDTDKDAYVFQNNLPIQVYQMKKKHPSPWDRVKVLEENVEVQDRRGVVRVFQNCFVASEAVDVLMKLKLVRSRGEGVHVMQKLNEKIKFFKSANLADQSDFRDDKTMFLQFTPEEERVPPARTSRTGSRKGSNRSISNSPKRTKSESSARSRSNSPTKDKAYFKSRAQDVRSGLSQFHEQRMAANTAA